MKKNILFIAGIPDNHQVKVISTHPNGSVSYENTGACDIYTYINPSTWNKQLLVLDSNPYHITLDPKTHCIVNQIAEPDSHTLTLERVKVILTEHSRIPVFNPPEHIEKTRRDHVYKNLQDIEGLYVPPTLRITPTSPREIFKAIEESELQYPIIVKSAGQHGGLQTLKLDNEKDIEKLYPLPLDGRTYYLIQFINTANEKGIYHKFRLVLIDGKIYPRHFRIHEHWMVHYYTAAKFMDKHPEYYDQENHFLNHFEENGRDKLSLIGKEIHKKIPLDMVGIDGCWLPDGRLMIFELNANMLFLENDLPQFKNALQNINQAIINTIAKKTERTPNL